MSIHNETLQSGLALVTFLTHHQHTCIEFSSTLTIDTFRSDDLFRISVSVSVPVPVPAFRVFHLPRADLVSGLSEEIPAPMWVPS